VGPDGIDQTDLELLRLLTTDGRATYAFLATQVGLSVAATKRRVDRLRDARVITGFTAQIDYSKLGWSVEAFTEVRFLGRTGPKEMLESIKKIPEVQRVSTLAGDPDTLIQLRAHNHDHLQDVISTLRQTGGTVGTKTLIVLGNWQRSEFSFRDATRDR
jgi:DNA-binding Lrp family transcriptional regulator